MIDIRKKEIYKMSVNSLSPFIKWVGGKTRFIHEIVPLIPEYEVYFEPFIGGGAIFFYLQPKKAYISDINIELINCYQVIRSSYYSDLKIYLDKLIEFNDKENYLEIRKKYNDLKKDYNFSIDDITNAKHICEEDVKICLTKTSYFIYLNKTGFRGLYRENQKGEFNVPFGNNNNLKTLYDDKILDNIHNYLSSSDISICHHSYKDIHPTPSDFVYLDPPYDKEKSTDFASYTKDEFQQKELYDFIQGLSCPFVLSNSPTQNIIDMYKDYKQKILSGKRSVDIKKIKTVKNIEIIISS